VPVVAIDLVDVFMKHLKHDTLFLPSCGEKLKLKVISFNGKKKPRGAF